MDKTTTVLEFRSQVAAPPDRVFAALTEGRHLSGWFCDHAESQPTNGGRLILSWAREGSTEEPFLGRWVVFETNLACAYEGGHPGYPDGYAGRVGFEMVGLLDGTMLVTRHRLPARPDYEPIAARYREVWPRVLARLAHYLTPTT